MNTEQTTDGRRVLRRYSVADRERLRNEYHASGQTRQEFCLERGIKLMTFHGWFKKAKIASKSSDKGTSGFAEVQVKRRAAPLEIEMPGGKRFGLYINDEAAVSRLIRGVLGC